MPDEPKPLTLAEVDDIEPKPTESICTHAGADCAEVRRLCADWRRMRTALDEIHNCGWEDDTHYCATCARNAERARLALP